MSKKKDARRAAKAAEQAAKAEDHKMLETLVYEVAALKVRTHALEERAKHESPNSVSANG